MIAVLFLIYVTFVVLPWNCCFCRERCHFTTSLLATLTADGKLEQPLQVGFTLVPHIALHDKGLKYLRKIVDEFVVWIVDVEYSSLPDAIPLEVTIKDLRMKRIILSTSVDYGTSVAALHASILAAAGPTLSGWHRKSFIEGFYDDSSTSDLSFSDISAKMTEAGFTPDINRVPSL